LQAYKSHEIYAIEKWLHKNQILHPKGPVLGFCSGHPVYPRTCVQTLKTKERWLRDGLQLKANEVPSKVSVFYSLPDDYLSRSPFFSVWWSTLEVHYYLRFLSETRSSRK